MDVITAVSLCGPEEKSQELAPGSKLTVTALRLVKETKESPRAVGKRLAGITTWAEALAVTQKYRMRKCGNPFMVESSYGWR
jgi:hypothetical protein